MQCRETSEQRQNKEKKIIYFYTFIIFPPVEYKMLYEEDDVEKHCQDVQTKLRWIRQYGVVIVCKRD